MAPVEPGPVQMSRVSMISYSTTCRGPWMPCHRDRRSELSHFYPDRVGLLILSDGYKASLVDVDIGEDGMLTVMLKLRRDVSKP